MQFLTNTDFNKNLIFFFAESNCGAHERALLNNLLAKYNTLERPVANESEPLEVKFGITLQQIIDVVSFQDLMVNYAGVTAFAPPPFNTS